MRFVLILFTVFNFYLVISEMTGQQFDVDLNSQNFDSFLKQNSPVLVMFYAKENCPNCEKALSTLYETDQKLAFDYINVKIVRISDEDKELLKKHDVLGFPTLKLIDTRYGYSENFLSELNSDSLLNFIIKYYKTIWQEVNSIGNLEAASNEKKVSILVCGSNVTFPEIFEQRTTLKGINEDIELLFTRDRELYKSLECELNDVILLKQHTQERLKYKYTDSFNMTDFQEWIAVYSHPLVFELNDDTIQLALTRKKIAVLTIKDGDYQQEIDLILNKLALKNRVNVNNFREKFFS